jgi:hypothetical protein
MRHKQDRTIERLEVESLRAIDKLVMQGSLGVKAIWDEAIDSMRNSVIEEYRRDFGRDKWNLTLAAKMGTFNRIDRRIAATLSAFHSASILMASMVFRDIYFQGVLRNAWMIDQVTPPSYDVKLPKSPMFKEADPVYRGPESDTAWKVRWSAWMDAYRASLNQNLRLGAMNESEINDAADEVEATRPGSPQADMWNAIEKVYTNQADTVYSSAQIDVSEANPQLEIVEIWQTRYYDRVCDICDENRGLTRDEADSDIPAHPNCGCFWRLVPKSWRALLMSGDQNDVAIAKAMDASGEVPNAMLIFNDDGKLVGSTIVEFDTWAENKMAPIQSR